jgi:hypothetical protein
MISAARDIHPAALRGSLWQSGTQLALRFTRSAVILWHRRSNSTAHTAVSQNVSWCCVVSACKQLPVEKASHPKRLEHSLTTLRVCNCLFVSLTLADIVEKRRRDTGATSTAHLSTVLDDWWTVHCRLVDFQLDAQNSYLFIHNTFIKILYMFRALPYSSSGGLCRNCTYAASGIVTLCRWLSCAPVKKELNRYTGQSPAESDDTRGCIYTITT